MVHLVRERKSLMITHEQLSCMWAAAYFRFKDAKDDIEKAYWLGKTEAIEEAIRLWKQGTKQ
jgi:hypothetical protein